MKNKVIDSIGNIDENMVRDVDALRHRKKPSFIKWGALAACLCVAIAIGVFFANKPVTPIQSIEDSSACGTIISYNGDKYGSIVTIEDLKEKKLPEKISEEITGDLLTYLELGGEYDYQETNKETDKSLYKCLLKTDKEIVIIHDGNGSWFAEKID